MTHPGAKLAVKIMRTLREVTDLGMNRNSLELVDFRLGKNGHWYCVSRVPGCANSPTLDSFVDIIRLYASPRVSPELGHLKGPQVQGWLITECGRYSSG